MKSTRKVNNESHAEIRTGPRGGCQRADAEQMVRNVPQGADRHGVAAENEDAAAEYRCLFV